MRIGLCLVPSFRQEKRPIAVIARVDAGDVVAGRSGGLMHLDTLAFSGRYRGVRVVRCLNDVLTMIRTSTASPHVRNHPHRQGGSGLPTPRHGAALHRPGRHRACTPIEKLRCAPGGGGGHDLVAAGAVHSSTLRPGQARILLAALLASKSPADTIVSAFGDSRLA